MGWVTGRGSPLERHAQTVSQTVHEIEVRRHLDHFEDAAVVQAGVPERPEVRLPYLARLQGELLRIGEDRVQARVELCLPPPLGDRADELLIPRDRTERRPVMCDSVAAPVDPGDHHGDGLALGS